MNNEKQYHETLINFQIGDGVAVAPREEISLSETPGIIHIGRATMLLTDKQKAILKDKLLAYDNPESEEREA